MRPFVLVVAPNPFEDAKAPAHEFEFWVRTRSGHLASFANLVHLFNRVGASQPAIVNPGKAARPLAGYYLESFLKTHGYDARVAFAVDDEGTWAACDSAKPVAVALSTTFITSVAELARTLRRVRQGVGPDIPVVVGGQFVWKQHLWGPERFADREEFEGRPDLIHLFSPVGDPILRDPIYVASEFGEHTLLALLEAFRRGARTPLELPGVANLVFWTAEGWRATRHAPEPIDLDRDFTRWDVVDEMPPSMVPVRTSVGCPHKCEFCDFVAVHPHLRLRSPSSIVDELRLIAARGGKSVSFVDDNALSSRGRARSLAQAISETELGIAWGGYLRADRIREADAVLLARAGLMYGWCGIESGDPDILRAMCKHSDPEAARVGIDSLTRAGVTILATMVLGFPGETRASVDRTIAFLNGLQHGNRGAVEYLLFPFHVFPGAPVDRPERRREVGLNGLFDRWQHATMSVEEVHAIWAPYFFRGVDPSYSYYGGDRSSLWNASRRNEAIAQRKALAMAFLDGAPDEVVQDRFVALHRTLCFTRREAPDWRDSLAPREQQPTAVVPSSAAGPRRSAAGGP